MFKVYFVACVCNKQGVEKGDETCDKNGKCNCRCDVIGDKCNECEIGHHGFPNCTGKFVQTSITYQDTADTFLCVQKSPVLD